MTSRVRRMAIAAGFAAVLSVAASGQTGGGYDLTWSSVDGGATAPATLVGGGYGLGGTVGQPDAGATLSAGGFALVVGFWPAVTIICNCSGDVNGDGVRNGADVQRFVACVLAGQGNCTCADVDLVNGVTVNDAAVFVALLLGPANCP
ncbi:MAG: hypothetical protein U1A27_01140 [Phycisphaerae bacterium]